MTIQAPLQLRGGNVSSEVELSVVIPCLNEATTIERASERAIDAMAEHGIPGEVVVSDNGSSDGSIEIAAERRARESFPADSGLRCRACSGVSVTPADGTS